MNDQATTRIVSTSEARRLGSGASAAGGSGDTGAAWLEAPGARTGKDSGCEAMGTMTQLAVAGAAGTG